MSYPYVLLGDYIDILSGFAFKSKDFSENGIPVIKIKNIVPPYVTLEDLSYVPNEIAKLNQKYLLTYNDVLIALTGSHINQMASVVGRIARVKYNIPSLLNQRVGKITVKNEGSCDINYVYYFLSQEQIKIALASKAGGAANQANISPSDIKKLIIPLPPIEIQRRIATILSAYDDLIENNRKQIKLLEEAAQRLYKVWFVDLRFPGHEHTKIVDGVPEGWKKRLLGDIVEVKYGKDHKSIPDGLIPVYGSGGFMRKCSQVLYDGESVLIPRKGSLNNIIYVDEAFWTVDTMFYTKMKMPNIGVFLYFFVKSFDMYSMNIGAAVPSMTTNILNALDIIVPSSNILEHFQSTTKMYFRKMELLQKQIETAMQARDRLLPKLMSGEVEV